MSPDAPLKSLQGQVRRITFQNPENGYTVAKMQVPGQADLTTLVGVMPELTEGQEIEAQGKVSLHLKYGPQIEVETYRILPVSGSEGVKRYLGSGLIKGIGPKLAERIVGVLGAQAVEIILNKPESLRKVPGIGSKKASDIKEAVAAHGELRELMVFLQSHGVGVSTALRLHREYGSGALQLLQSEPHRMAQDIRGIGFITADKIAAKLGISRDHPTRLRAGITHTLLKAREEGHVFLPYQDLMQQAAELLNVDTSILGEAFSNLSQKGKLITEATGHNSPVYLAPMHTLEKRASRALARLSRSPGLLNKKRALKAAEWAAGNMSIALSQNQRAALAILLSKGLAVLTGGPGTGKTTIVKALLAIAQKMNLSTALAAPTGRAAKRLSEASNHPALTLHRLLEYSPKEGAFQKNITKPLQQSLVIVDESSMIDLWLMAHLAEAVKPGGVLVLVGDADQLPSVGPGLVFAQVIKSRAAATAQLTEIFRQDKTGLIVSNAHRILKGEPLLLPGPGQESDFYFMEQTEPAKAAELIRDLVCTRLPRAFNLNPERDIQVLAPMRRGTLGCDNLNRLLRKTLNPDLKRPSLSELPEPGDKVMQTRNNYDLEVFNGDMGKVVAGQGEDLLVEMSGAQVVYTPAEARDLSLAYAVTIHKSQGSEYPAVVLALGMEHYIMLSRPILYTAITRGKKLVVVVGDKRALNRAVRNQEAIKRFANLDERIVSNINL